MNSNFLEAIGLSGLDMGIVILVMIILLIATLVITIINMRSIKNFQRKYYKFFKGKNAKSLETEIYRMFEENRHMQSEIKENRSDITNINRRMVNTIQKMGMVKYDAYNEMGGKLSFSLALLDEKNDGIVLNSVHSSEGFYSYIKKIEGGNSKIELSKEEKQALSKALNGDNNESDY